MEVYRTRAFENDFARLPYAIQKRFEAKLGLFLLNPVHPSLRVKKMGGTENIWEASITKGYRFTFMLHSQACVLRRIGTHDILRNP